MVQLTSHCRYFHEILYVSRGADKSLAWIDWKKQLKGLHFSSDAEVIATAETWLDEQPSDFFFLSGLQKLEFGRCSLFPPGRAKDLSASLYFSKICWEKSSSIKIWQ